MDRAPLAAFDEQLRQSLDPPAPGWLVERVGDVIRQVAPPGTAGSTVTWSRLDAGTADAAIAEQVAFFAAAGREFEWKAYGYDGPADLPDRLRAAGFIEEGVESLVVGEVADVVAGTAGHRPPDGVVVREVGDEDWPRIEALKTAVYGTDTHGRVEAVRAEHAADPEAISVHVAVAGDRVVSAAWVRFHAGTDFASLWGGATAPQWRQRGIYRALVARRAEQARERGFRYLQVDASPDSRPILERLGLVPLTTTTPWTWQPTQPQAAGRREP
ncbi:MAG: GNAT family N-acetyltransferase [Actinomycetota bacterium]|nr:GNAT family N-acetyltransferase [Actinomycetota bacterium]